jgi:CBS domain-containing protein
MTTPVVTATPEDGLGATAHTMTYSRLRHIPVVEDGQLVAIVSLGDVVKYRIDQLTDERNHLLEYLHTRRGWLADAGRPQTKPVRRAGRSGRTVGGGRHP